MPPGAHLVGIGGKRLGWNNMRVGLDAQPQLAALSTRGLGRRSTFVPQPRNPNRHVLALRDPKWFSAHAYRLS
jgi:hypothetical protein